MGCCGGKGHGCGGHDDEGHKHHHDHDEEHDEDMISLDEVVYNNDILLDSVIHMLIEKKVFTEKELMDRIKQIEEETEDDVEVSDDDEDDEE